MFVVKITEEFLPVELSLLTTTVSLFLFHCFSLALKPEKHFDFLYQTTEQLTGIYRMVADRRCSRLRRIDLYGNDHSSVSQDIQDRARLNESTEMITASVYV